MRSAERTLLSSLRIGAPLPCERLMTLLAGTDHGALVQRADGEGVAGLLYRDLRRAGLADALDPEAFELLRETYLRTAAANTCRRAALAELLAHPDVRDASVVVLKGMALLDDLYGDPGLRPMGDIDVWGEEGDIDRARAALLRLGYSEPPFYPDTLRRGAVTFDVHRSLLGIKRIATRAGILAGAQVEAYAAARPLDIGGHAALRLDGRDAAWFACLHLLKHNASRLLWVLEVEALLARLQPSELEELALLADRSGQRRALGIAGRLIAALPTANGAAMELPADASQADGSTSDNVGRLLRVTSGAPLSPLARRALRRHRRHGELPTWAPLLFFSPQRTRREQLIGTLETFFPRPDVLRQIFEDRDAWLATLYLRRAGQLLERLVRH